MFDFTARYTTQNEARAIIDGREGYYAAGHIDLTTGETYWMIKGGEVKEQGAPVRSERFIYTKSGKKRTSRELCGRVFKKFTTDRKAFIAAAIAMGVRPATANCMFSHYSVGRYAA